MSRARSLGVIGEQVAVRHLERAGFVVLARNWRCAQGGLRGEIDIVARDGAALVVCEVKARRGEAAGGPLAAVTPRKIAQLRRLVAAYLAVEGVRCRELRIDVVGVCWSDGGGRPEVVHLRGVT